MPELIIPPLTGGLADRVPDFAKKDNQLIVCENLNLDEAVLGVALPVDGTHKPYPPVSGLKDGDGNEIVDYVLREIIRTKSGSQPFPSYKYVLFGNNYAHGVRRDNIDGTNTYQFITGAIPSGITQIIEDGQKLYLLSKTASPKVFQWDGVEDDVDNPVIRDMGYSYDLITLGVTGTLSSGSIPTGGYGWLIVPTDENGNLFPTDILSPITAHISDNTSKMTFANLNLMENKLREKFYLGPNVYLYRASLGIDVHFTTPPSYTTGIPTENTIYQLVASSNWNTIKDAGYTWEDNNANPTTNLENITSTPPQDLIGAVLWNNRMFGYKKESPILAFSKEWAYELWPVYNQIVIGGSDPIRAIVPRGNNLVIFKDSEVYEFYGDSINNYNYQMISTVHGTNRPKTIQAIDNNRIIFVDINNRVWLYDGNFTEISLPINIKGNYFRSAVMGRYYLLWSKNLLGLHGYTPVLYDDLPEGGGGPLHDDPFWDAPSPDPYRDLDGTDPGGNDNPDEDDQDQDGDEDDVYTDGNGVKWVIGEAGFPNCYAYHVMSGVWTIFTNKEIKVVEQPSRGGEGTLLYYDGIDLVLIGDDRFDINAEPLRLRSKFFFSTDYQEKRFRDIEVEVYNRSGKNLNDVLVGELKIYTNGEFENEAETVPIIYTAQRTGQQRISHRFINPILGTTIGVEFWGNIDTKNFEIRDMRIHWEPRGTARR